MRILIAPQALKGSLSAAETGAAIAQGVLSVFPAANLTIIPIADGGEGTVQALVDATHGQLHRQTVTGPLGEPVEAFYGLTGDGQTAVIEMAASSGLPLVAAEQRNPLLTTTYGVGELITAALDQGCRHFILGIGGSATNDGGAGMAQALGVEFLDADSASLPFGGAALARLARIDTSKLDPRIKECAFDVACDVTNPLCGPTGASAIYGPQKGATPAMVEELDAALAHYAHIIQHELKQSVADIPGSGAAGGLGAGMLAFLGANLRAGAQIILEALRVEEYMKNSDLVITAEGQLDEQTAYGKSVGAIAGLARAYKLPVLAVAGGLGKNYRGIYDLGIDGLIVLPTGPMSLVYAMEHAASLTSQAAERALRLFNMGRQFKGEA
ncbi:glycerate kinase [Dictyobacter kobayashii]|uniref:Glycerate kinase n=1 Tax=Dictyobacter kobayashii TaxID=2014872 RepID=A0A402AN14_9CHLR|nr:glycerate kinase [Dictyobacter kobayashii]GCE20506.1 glycerate kinase [Dictyobacter kobayashii]